MKNTYVISYDLPKEGDYSALFERIKNYQTWAHITESTWAVVSDSTAVEIRDNLKQVAGQDARIIVVQSAHVAAWKNVLCNSDWLKKNI